MGTAWRCLRAATRKTSHELLRAAVGPEAIDPTDFQSVVSVILHYIEITSN